MNAAKNKNIDCGKGTQHFILQHAISGCEKEITFPKVCGKRMINLHKSC